MSHPVQAAENGPPDLPRYLASRTRTDEQDLVLAARLLQPTPDDQMLDIACGAGQTTLFFAPLVRQVVASDLTMQMLKRAQEQISEKSGIENVTYREADAEDLPFPAGSFTLLTCRTATHHFPNLSRAIDEFHRVLRRGGRIAIIDVPMPEDEEIAAFHQQLESSRNPTHVRTYTENEWRTMLTEADFIVQTVERVVIPLDFYDWLKQKGIGREQAKRINQMFSSASHKVQNYFQVEVFAGEVEAFAEPRLVIVANRPEKEKK